ncbi:DUF3237 domain-containing protein [Nocardia ninae]
MGQAGSRTLDYKYGRPYFWFVTTETGAEQYSWLNDIVCVGSGYLIEGGVAYQVSQVL